MSRKPADVASKERNEYIPSFISKKPFYIDDDSTSDADYLEHQRLHRRTPDHEKWYDRGKKAGPAATKFRKGACENCGAMTHKTKECLSRPRKMGAKWTGKDIQADEMVQKVEMSWDAKRDRWNGYDPKEYRAIVEEYNDLEELKRKTKDEGDTTPVLLKDREDGAEGIEEAKYAEESDMGRHQSTATRNLRLREDTAKYLLNLDLDSAKYDPKTRSMVDMGAQADQAAALVAEDNFMRASGDAAEFEKAQKYAWESQERGDRNKIHLQANPTSGEFLRKQENAKNEAKREAQRKVLLEKYGGEQYLQSTPLRDLAVVENENYFEYDEAGVIKGTSVKIAKSKYAEDVYLHNHKSVWGSWWSSSKWGYACCHSTVKNSYCIGEEGKRAFADIEKVKTSGNLEPTRGSRGIGLGGRDFEQSVIKDRGQYELQPTAKKRSMSDLMDRKDEELDAYKKSKTLADDPMVNCLGRDELID
ncbi:MAG: mRNA splicing protein [Cirrosporium novae-zelandiae]|nr:MAG: mRNA splicing protein [Cirrosporium novae-zelandiae]